LEARDLIVTPLFVFLIYLAAFIVRPLVTDELNRQYFMTGLMVRIFGALALGFLYQFYYHGGDTYNFHTHGSRIIWNAFWDSPEKGLQLLFASTENEAGIYKYSSQIPFFHDKSSFMVIRISSVIDLITFSAYSATAICFAVISFIGSWLLFLTFYQDRKEYHRSIAMATLFIPSVCFWGSGLLKDTITLAALGVLTYVIKKIFITRKLRISWLLMAFLSVYLIYSIKIYILLCFLPAVLIWIFFRNLKTIRSTAIRVLLLPFVLVLTISTGYYAIVQVSSSDEKYNLETIGQTAQITAYDIAYLTGQDAGSTYTLGDLDGSLGSLLRLAPQAVNVSLFRPYLWEVRNPLMLMSAFESLALLLLTLYVIRHGIGHLSSSIVNADALFCLVFSITFAFAVGVSTFNFGSLSRYKIPLLPFYLMALLVIHYNVNKERKLSELELTE
jgi:hypothetical protein